MVLVKTKAEKPWKCGKCSPLFSPKQRLSCHKYTNCGTKKLSCDNCLKSFISDVHILLHSTKVHARGSRDYMNEQNVRKNSNMSGICFVMSVFLKKKNKNWDALTVEKAILERTTFIHMFVRWRLNPRSTYHWSRWWLLYCRGRNQLMILSMLQEYFQDDEMEFLSTMVAPENLTVHKEDLVSSVFIFLPILIKWL